jgi:hypothetical protein
MKSEYLERRFKLNAKTTVVIKSKKYKDAEYYSNTVSLIHSSASDKPLNLFSRKEIMKYLDDIELEDDQIELGFGVNPD